MKKVADKIIIEIKSYGGKIKMLNKKGESGILVAVAIIAVILIGMGAYNQGWLAPIASPPVKAPGEPGAQVSFCPEASHTLTVGPAKVKLSPSTSITTKTHRVYVNGVDQGAKTDSTTMTVKTGSIVEIAYVFADATYNSDYVKFNMPCGAISSAEISTPGSKSAVNGQLVSLYDASYKNANEVWTADVDYAITAFNGDTNADNNLGASNETLDTGEWGYFNKIKIQGAAEQGISPPRHGIAKDSRLVIVVEVNGTAYDESKTTWTGGNAGIKKDDSAYPSKLYTLANVDSKAITFTALGCPREGETVCNLELGDLAVKVETTANPIGGGATDDIAVCDVGNGNVQVKIYTEEFFQHTDDNTIQFSVAKDDGAIASQLSTTFDGQCLVVA